MPIKALAPHIGKHKIPRYLYHLTTEKNYLSMLSESKLKQGGEYDEMKGVYMMELANFFKRWLLLSKDGFSGNDLRQKLIKQITKGSEENMIILKISTQHIDKTKLFIRSQTKLFEGNNYDLHSKKFDSATNSSLYKQRKEAIEYIYPDEIDISKIEKIGSTKVKVYTSAGVEFFSNLLKGTPEEKALVLFKQ